MEPRYSNWEKYVYNFGSIRPISLPPIQLKYQMDQIKAFKPEAKSEAPRDFNPDQMFKEQHLHEAISEPERPRSPMMDGYRSIFRPFPKDMCGNPNAYFPGGKMKKWQRKQVVEASLHCC
jgi:hypothetical protein